MRKAVLKALVCANVEHCHFLYSIYAVPEYSFMLYQAGLNLNSQLSVGAAGGGSGILGGDFVPSILSSRCDAVTALLELMHYVLLW